MTFGEKLKEIIERYGVSQRKLAALSGVNYVTINRIVNNYPYQVTLKTANSLIEALQCTELDRRDLIALVSPVITAIECAIDCLESGDIQKKRYRMGRLASQNIDSAIAALRDAIKMS